MSNQDSSITKEEVKKVAGLAMLDLADEEVETYTPQLASILELAKQMDGFDLSDFEPTAHPHGLVNVYRDDVVEEANVTASVLSNAPEAEGNQFRVPPALGEEL